MHLLRILGIGLTAQDPPFRVGWPGEGLGGCGMIGFDFVRAGLERWDLGERRTTNLDQPCTQGAAFAGLAGGSLFLWYLDSGGSR